MAVFGLDDIHIGRGLVTNWLNEEKGAQWRGEMHDVLSAREMDTHRAQKTARRLHLHQCSSRHRPGRSYVRLIYNQASRPVSPITPLLSRSLYWWATYPALAPRSHYFASEANDDSILAWTDASGFERRQAFVAWRRVAGRWSWNFSAFVLPDEIWQTLLCRRDNHIQLIVFAAAVLMLETLRPTGSYLQCYFK
jgi:hypothetical protein